MGKVLMQCRSEVTCIREGAFTFLSHFFFDMDDRLDPYVEQLLSAILQVMRQV